MGRVATLASTTVGSKFIVALTGSGPLGFVIVHMLGNLQIFLGPDAINAYADFMKQRPLPVWTFRLGLLVALRPALILALRLKRASWPAPDPLRLPAHGRGQPRLADHGPDRPDRPRVRHLSPAALHFGVTNPQHFQMKDPLGRQDVYAMMVLGFQNVYIAAA